MSFICNFCEKEYRSLSSLNYHQKTTKFCLEIQNKNKEKERNIISFECKFCNKEFLQKSNLKIHTLKCKEKITSEKLEEIENKVKQEYEKRIEKLEHSLLDKDNIIYEYVIQIKVKDETIKQLEQKINEKDKHILDINKQLVNQLTCKSSTTIYNNTYNVQYNQLFENLKPFTSQNLNESIRTIRHDNLCNSIEKVDDCFVAQFVKCLKEYMFTTDSSRNILVVKKEDGKPDKMQAEKFIMDCLKIGKIELKKLVSASETYIREQENIGEITSEEYLKYLDQILILNKYIIDEKQNIMVTKAATKLIKNSNKLSSNKTLTAE